jgi:hypothetical protein
LLVARGRVSLLHMSMVLAVFLLGLAFCATKRECAASIRSLRSAWLFYGWAVITQILFAIIEAVVRVDNGYDVKGSLAAVEGWQLAVTWLLLAMTVFALRDAFTSTANAAVVTGTVASVPTKTQNQQGYLQKIPAGQGGRSQSQQRQYSTMSHDELSVLWNEFMRLNPDGARAPNSKDLWKEFLVSKAVSFDW